MSQAEDDPTGVLSLRIDDPELATALEDAADEVGSKSKTVRSALREKLLEESEEDVEPFDGDVPRKAREGHRKLVEFVGLGGHLEIDAAESIMANHLNIKTLSVRQVVTRPLVNAGWLSRQQGVHEVALVVRDPREQTETTSDDVLDELEASDEPDVDTDADDVETASDRLDELAAATEGVDDE